jgi:four helix bundle protein
LQFCQGAVVARINTFRELEVWNLSMEQTTTVYRLTNRFPRSEQFGLTAQMRRSAVSIPANIAEGHNRRSRRAYLNHVGIALGSLAELDTLVELSTRLQFGDPSDAATLRSMLPRVGQMLHGLARSLDRCSASEYAERRTPNAER